mmetsp:Transcript_14700/g.18623  ORF Transcript_14700/g.18623 Transcript_14700/m.18623 type:complete len:90 (-) Transcript_14700:1816-2085(-)|eukprot:CAMPEP_0203654414 /NCGR_PEP_ID=MMETSP0088-20131115/35142_1 /ASSEMBLY_ACC=CAM_ASM_001087 /TAXON_ID=426623 /ORGANISM="Chaetoceros affinis, Strain CCMP159" /LENGTH=89 /DNA_ID=CAMNT_0050514689 /DNA_START=186 /DNA_END=455 /DNA_ORIENTATION=-
MSIDMNASTKDIYDQLLSTQRGIILTLLMSFACSLLFLKLRDYMFGPDLLTLLDRSKCHVDFDRRVLEGQESNLRELNRNRSANATDSP